MDDRRVQLAAAAAAATALVALWAGCRSRPLSEEELAKLKSVLKELSRRFFGICREVAGIAQTVNQKTQKSQAAFDQRTLQLQLRQQCRVYERLTEIQEEVAKEFGLTVTRIEEMTQATHDEEVKAFAQAFQGMLNDALNGQNPILPNTTIPSKWTEEKVLAMQGKVQEMEITRVGSQAWRGCGHKDLEKLIAVAEREAWEQVLKENGMEVKGGLETYQSVDELFLRSGTASYKKKKDELAGAYTKRMVEEVARRVK